MALYAALYGPSILGIAPRSQLGALGYVCVCCHPPPTAYPASFCICCILWLVLKGSPTQRAFQVSD